MSEIKPNFSDEVMLAGWSETHNGGAKVTFWLNDSQALDAFKSLTVAKGKTAGQRFMMVLVEIDDNEQPKAPVTIDSDKPKGGFLSQWLALRCKEPEFWAFVESSYMNCLAIENEIECNDATKVILKIESKTELDNDKEAEARFHRIIRLPYAQWLAGAR